MKQLAATAVAAVLLATSCGPRVKPISLHDPSIPVDSRRFVADTQDAVAIARVKRDEAASELTRVREWRRTVVRGLDWPRSADAAIDRLEILADGRVELAELELDRADAALELALAKYDLVTAETAIRHDIARYDLAPLRARTDAAREQMKGLSETIILKRDEIDELASQWWSAYAGWAKKGDTRLYYVPFIDVEASKAPAKKRKKAAAPDAEDDKAAKKKGDAEKEPADTKKPAKGDAEPAKSDEADELRIW